MAEGREVAARAVEQPGVPGGVRDRRNRGALRGGRRARGHHVHRLGARPAAAAAAGAAAPAATEHLRVGRPALCGRCVPFPACHWHQHFSQQQCPESLLPPGTSPVRGRGRAAAALQSPASVQIAASPAASTPGLTPELRQMLNADVEVRRAASLDQHARDPSSDIDSGEPCQVWALPIDRAEGPCLPAHDSFTEV